MTIASRKKLARASLVVFVPLLLIGISGHRDAMSSNNGFVGSPTDLGMTFGSVFAEENFEDQRCLLPPYFETEVLEVGDFSEVHVSADKSVVGFFFSKDVVDTKDFCTTALEEKGWTEIESGQEGFASFIGENEHYSWVLLSCTDVGENTAVVLQVGS